MTEPERLNQQKDDEHPNSELPSVAPRSPAPPEPSKDQKKPLTPEEQMALYEKELKETDWGHQPC